MRRNSISSLFIGSAMALATLALPLPAFAQDAVEEEDESYTDIIVTASSVRQGGAQDVRHFRSVALVDGIPDSDSLTIEGLMGEHDLTMAANRPCAQTLCITASAMQASLPTRPDDKLFVGLGFSSNIAPDGWRREPLNLVAVVDKSGSMDGRPLDLVRESLLQILGQMKAGDRMGIVLYGNESHVYLEPSDVGDNRGRIAAAIRAIESNGSTNMEAGLRVGYDLAHDTAPAFKGNTRVMLFTDEQPNVGNTDAGTFMGMAREASAKGIGLTTIGVGVQFDGALATRVSSVRGGNLFFIDSLPSVKTVFAKELDNMVSEVAHDVRLTMTPATGQAITGIFGVPDGLMEQGKDGTISVVVPTAFLSSNGGGIFVSLGKDSSRSDLPAAPLDASQPLMTVSLAYFDARTSADHADNLAVAVPDGRADKGLARAHALVDQFVVMRDSSKAYHAGDEETAFRMLDALSSRLAVNSDKALKPERELVSAMRGHAAYRAGYTLEAPKATRHLDVVGEWKVLSVRGMEDLSRGDTVEFTEDNELITYFAKPRRGRDELTQGFAINERQIRIDDQDPLLFALANNRLTISSFGDGAKIVMVRE